MINNKMLGAPIGIAMDDKKALYSFAENWAVSSNGRILRFNTKARNWQTPKRALFCLLKTINDKTLKSEVLSKIIDFENLIIDGYTIDTINYKINDESFKRRGTKNDFIAFHGWTIDIKNKKISKQGEQDEIIKHKVSALIKAFYTDEKFLSADCFVSSEYFLKE